MELPAAVEAEIDRLCTSNHLNAEPMRVFARFVLRLKPASTESMAEAKDVAIKASLCAQIMLQNPVVVANEKARHICVDTRDSANAFLAKHPADPASPSSLASSAGKPGQGHP